MDWSRLVRLTKYEYYADFFITPPITLALILSSTITPDWCVKVILGFIGWSLVEYLIHRFISHKAPLLKEWHFLHHSNQTDYIAVHPILTVSLYAFFWAIFGFGSNPLMIGYYLGYILYSILHTMFHYSVIKPGHPLYQIKLNHIAHHRKDVNFGVTTPFWDHVFRTHNG